MPENSDHIIKKPKLSMEASKTCSHWLKRKNRLCKMTVAKGSIYCGEHLPQESSKDCNDDNSNESINSRITCPLDPKHTVYKKNLEKHLKICNARQKEDLPAYVQKGINYGEATESLEGLDKLKLSEINKDEFNQIIEKVKQVHENLIVGNISTSTARHDILNEELANEEYGKETKKHLIQAAALLGILEEEQQLQAATGLIEFGAGKGQLAYFLALLLKNVQDSKVILVDRMSLRHKKDNKIDDKSLLQRIRVDIADFDMNRLDLLEKCKRVVAVSKHLCGAATDLTLRCITQANFNSPFTDFILIALCCHHRCDWRTFVGKEFFKAQNITPREFVIMTKMVSWAICGTGMSRERRLLLENQTTVLDTDKVNNTHGFSVEERQRIGFMCKRILDLARVEYLRGKGYDACLKYYVSNDVTLENVCLMAKKIS